jgi:hypothetical protein
MAPLKRVEGRSDHDFITNAAGDIVHLEAGLSASLANAILEQWIEKYPIPRRPEFNVKLGPKLPFSSSWLITVGGPGAHPCSLQGGADCQFPIHLSEVMVVSDNLVMSWRSTLQESRAL